MTKNRSTETRLLNWNDFALMAESTTSNEELEQAFYVFQYLLMVGFKTNKPESPATSNS